jgi:hypothetical protein
LDLAAGFGAGKLFHCGWSTVSTADEVHTQEATKKAKAYSSNQ